MRRALLISPVFPDENGSGRAKRAHQWLHQLSGQYEVSLLVVQAGGEAGVQDRLLRMKGTADTRILGRSISRGRKLGELAASLGMLLAGKVRGSEALGWYPLRMAHVDPLTRWYEGQRFERVVCFRLYLQEYALLVGKLTKAGRLELDMDDVESTTRFKLAGLLYRRGHYKEALVSWLSAVQFRLQEQRIDSRFERLHVCSEEDRSLFSARHPALATVVMPNRIPASSMPERLPLPSDVRQMLFVGTLSYYPNEEAVVWFIRHVLPRLRRQDRRWTLHVAGMDGSESLRRKLERTAGVRYHGQVAAMAPLYGQAYQVISPLHAGGGTKLKVMEAMQYGRPIIATRESVHGLGLTPEVHYLEAETAEQFLDACGRLAEHPELASQLAASAYRIVRERYSY